MITFLGGIPRKAFNKLSKLILHDQKSKGFEYIGEFKQLFLLAVLTTVLTGLGLLSSFVLLMIFI